MWTEYAANKKLILFAHNNTGNLIPPETILLHNTHVSEFALDAGRERNNTKIGQIKKAVINTDPYYQLIRAQTFSTQ